MQKVYLRILFYFHFRLTCQFSFPEVNLTTNAWNRMLQMSVIARQRGRAFWVGISGETVKFSKEYETGNGNALNRDNARPEDPLSASSSASRSRGHAASQHQEVERQTWQRPWQACFCCTEVINMLQSYIPISQTFCISWPDRTYHG